MARNGRVNKTADLRSYMRDYMRARHNYDATKDRYAPKFVEFKRIVLAGSYGTIADLARQVGITRDCGRKWLIKMRGELRQARAGGAA